MRVTDLAKRKREPVSPMKAKVLRHFEEHSDQVFPYRDEELAHALNVKTSALSFTLWGLYREGLIDRETADGKVYFGSRHAVAELRRRLGLTKEDPFQKARDNAERIRAREGNVNTLELLDTVRGPWA